MKATPFGHGERALGGRRTRGLFLSAKEFDNRNSRTCIRTMQPTVPFIQSPVPHDGGLPFDCQYPRHRIDSAALPRQIWALLNAVPVELGPGMDGVGALCQAGAAGVFRSQPLRCWCPCSLCLGCSGSVPGRLFGFRLCIPKAGSLVGFCPVLASCTSSLPQINTH